MHYIPEVLKLQQVYLSELCSAGEITQVYLCL